MQNALIYYYDMHINNLQKINEEYFFAFQNQNFIITNYNRKLNEATALYELNMEMLNYGYPMYEIILTKDLNVLFFHEKTYYILMKLPNSDNHVITYEEMLDFSFVPCNQKIINALDKSLWPIFWEEKIDYFERRIMQQLNKYPLINESINFYIGMWENAISYYNDNVISSSLKEVCHKRIAVDTDLLSFYNPLNLLIDYKERDISEYLKSYITKENFTLVKLSNMLDKLLLDRNKAILLISRTMFPSLYFDQYEEITVNGLKEEKINEYIRKRKEYFALIKLLFEKYYVLRIPYINWIQKEDYY